MTNVSKRVKKQKKYENDINRLQNEYDKYREKDPKEFEKVRIFLFFARS